MLLFPSGTLAGWGIALYALLRVLLDTAHPNKQHPILLGALFMGWCGLLAYFIWLLGDNSAWLRFAFKVDFGCSCRYSPASHTAPSCYRQRCHFSV